MPPQTTAPTVPSTGEQTSTPPTEPEADALTLLRQEIAGAQCEAGLAFLGYVGYDSTREEVEAFVAQGPLAEKYPFLTQAPVVLAPGQELYALIPGRETQSLQVYPSGISLEGEYEDDWDTLLFNGEPGQILLLRCNESEVFSNVLVSLFGGTDILEFRPSVSLKDGHLAALPGVYDFSLYEDDEAPSVSEAMALLLTAPEIQEGIDLGLTLMYTGQSQWIEGKAAWFLSWVPSWTGILPGRSITPWGTEFSLFTTVLTMFGRPWKWDSPKGKETELWDLSKQA